MFFRSYENHILLYQEASGATPLINEIIGAQIKRLLELQPLDVILSKLETYYEGSFWFTKNENRTFSIFVKHFDSFILKSYTPPRKKQGKICPKCNKHYVGSFCRNCLWEEGALSDQTA